MIRKIETDAIDIIEPMWVLLNEMHKEFDREIREPVRTTTWLERREQLIGKSGFNLGSSSQYQGHVFLLAVRFWQPTCYEKIISRFPQTF